jgi:hypothetical protein
MIDVPKWISFGARNCLAENGGKLSWSRLHISGQSFGPIHFVKYWGRVLSWQFWKNKFVTDNSTIQKRAASSFPAFSVGAFEVLFVGHTGRSRLYRSVQTLMGRIFQHSYGRAQVNLFPPRGSSNKTLHQTNWIPVIVWYKNGESYSHVIWYVLFTTIQSY